MGLTCSSRERSIPLATGLEQQATVADLVPAALDRFNQPFNLPAGEVLPVVNLQRPSASVPRRRRPPSTPFFSAFAPVYHFVCGVGGTVVLPVFKREICNTRKPMNAQMSQSNRHEVARAGRRVSQGVILRKPTPTRCPIFHPNTPSPIASILPTTSWPGTRVGESYWKSVAPDARDLRYSKMSTRSRDF
jgi:hypothetical protein